MMLSPAGVCKKPDGFDFKNLKKGQGPPKFIKKMARSAWKNKWSPFGMMRKSGSWGAKKMVNYYLNRRIGDALKDDEREQMATYMHQCFMREGSTEYAIFICFELGMYAVNPLELENRLGNPEFDCPISFIYGDIDWMDFRGGERIIAKNKYKDGLSQVYIVNECDHHLYLDNPSEFAYYIINDILMTEKALFIKSPPSIKKP